MQELRITFFVKQMCKCSFVAPDGPEAAPRRNGSIKKLALERTRK